MFYTSFVKDSPGKVGSKSSFIRSFFMQIEIIFLMEKEKEQTPNVYQVQLFYAC